MILPCRASMLHAAPSKTLAFRSSQRLRVTSSNRELNLRLSLAGICCATVGHQSGRVAIGGGMSRRAPSDLRTLNQASRAYGHRRRTWFKVSSWRSHKGQVRWFGMPLRSSLSAVQHLPLIASRPKKGISGVRKISKPVGRLAVPSIS